MISLGKKFQKGTGRNLFQAIVNLCTIIALIIQCIDVPDSLSQFVPFIAYVVIALVIISIIVNIISKRKSVLTRDQLVEITKNRMINSTGRIVMFGGDLSWTDDYTDTITKLTSNSQIVEIIYPLEKINNAKQSVKTRFEKNVQSLKQAGANIYCTEKDYHLRCTLIDVEIEQENENLTIISSKRVYKNISKPNKNKYQTNILNYPNNDERSLCTSFYLNYRLIRDRCKEHREV